MSKKLKKRLIIAAVLLVMAALSAWGFAMETVRYKVSSDKLDSVIKIVFISDLHNCFYGDTKQSKLIQEVKSSSPDIVIFGGDVIDAWGGTKYALLLIKELSKDYPCFYTPGNHEQERDDKEEFYAKVQKLCPMLLGEYEQISINGQDIRIYGTLDNYSFGKKKTQLEECFDTLDDKYYNILIAHQPEQIDSYIGKGKGYDTKFDLILSGHAHGGQWRIPKLLDQGLYAPDQGIFPDYTTGMYEYDGTTHIISRGLARPMRMIFIPRIFNRPELSVITIGQ
ncbi:metallophosphoesterase [uncultured Ruminococcus sp.]|uniref:metallophosphoesterase n=1 Tax=uncultured Ruminococcus sp. TaxID=165186 RepID=UPI0025F90568|nr:metallophosphoesterase [uncultured Ruminococcus sp.]